MTPAAQQIRQRHPGLPAPEVGLVLGSGLGGLAGAVGDAVALDYADLNGFPVAQVAGHAGHLVLGELGGRRVAVLQGRAHVYEGTGPGQIGTPIRTLRALGARTLLLTNAAGSLRPHVGPGRLMAICDHINMMGVNPLIGANEEAVGPRFVALGDAYDPVVLRALRGAATAIGVDLAEGVYLAVSGPSFETAAEIRAFGRLGADAVGMSTVPEVIVARHCGLRVGAISAITNLAEGLGGERIDHEQTLRGAALAAADLERLLVAVLEELPA